MTEQVAISSTDYWVKVVGMLQQNWALIEPQNAGGARVYFITDTSEVFDELAFTTEHTARDAFDRNGFRRLADEPALQSFLHGPSPPFHRATHPNGAIYLSGRFWQS